jgi:hypothetical protein
MSLIAHTGFESPYNPDSDNYDMIGKEDLLSIRILYRSEFREEELHLSQDSSSAIIQVGELVNKNGVHIILP